MSTAIQALASRIKKLSREELLSLSREDAAAIDVSRILSRYFRPS
jgi:hypothetical protein